MEGNKFTFRMWANIRFNRPIDRDKDYISPGGYEFVMNGKTVCFDFEDYEGYICKDNPFVLQTLQKNPDYTTFPDLLNITPDDLANVEKIEEFYVYTGEAGESDLEPLEVIDFGFEIIPEDDSEIIEITCEKVTPYFFPKDCEVVA